MSWGHHQGHASIKVTTGQLATLRTRGQTAYRSRWLSCPLLSKQEENWDPGPKEGLVARPFVPSTYAVWVDSPGRPARLG